MPTPTPMPTLNLLFMNHSVHIRLHCMRWIMDVQRMDIQRLPSFEVMIVTAT